MTPPPELPSQEIRPRRAVWVRRVLVPALLALGSALLTLLLIGRGWAWIVLLLPALAFALRAWRQYRSLSQDRLCLSPEGLQATLGGQQYKAAWKDVLAAWSPSDFPEEPLVCLGLVDRVVSVPIRLLDGPQVWEAVRRFAPEAALAPQTFRDLPSYQEWSALERLQVQPDPARLSYRLMAPPHYPWVGAGLCLFALVTGGFALAQGEPGAALLLALLILPGWLLLSLNGSFEISASGITRLRPARNTHLDWSKLERLETDPTGLIWLLVGSSSRLALPGPGAWHGEQVDSAYHFCRAQLEAQAVPTRTTLAVFSHWLTAQRPK